MKLIKDTKKIITGKFKKVIIWGFRTNTNDSFMYIYSAFYETLLKLDVEVLWVDDRDENNDLISKYDLVIAANISASKLRIKNNVYYCLHNFDQNITQKIKDKYLLRLQVYTDDSIKDSKKIDDARRYSESFKTLYQPWGTNLYPTEFYDIVYPKMSPFVYWVGSIWDNELNQGNTAEIKGFKEVLSKNGLKFIHQEYVNDSDNIKFVRSSRIAQSIAGNWQVDNNYLPCRMFKNISYGQMGITNVLHFNTIFKGYGIYEKNINELVEKSLSIAEKDWINITRQQQQIIATKYTYAHSLYYIANYFDIG